MLQFAPMEWRAERPLTKLEATSFLNILRAEQEDLLRAGTPRFRCSLCGKMPAHAVGLNSEPKQAAPKSIALLSVALKY